MKGGRQLWASGGGLIKLAVKTRAPEDWRTPRRFALFMRIEIRASVLECGGPPPLSSVLNNTSLIPFQPRGEPEPALRHPESS